MLYDKKWDLSQASRDLLSAADYMDQHGWCQHIAENKAGEVCITGAIDLGMHGERSSKRFQAAYYQFRDAFGLMSVMGWNDFDCKSKEQAVGALRQAAYATVAETVA
jgi:hypothetical protein